MRVSPKMPLVRLPEHTLKHCLPVKNGDDKLDVEFGGHSQCVNKCFESNWRRLTGWFDWQTAWIIFQHLTNSLIWLRMSTLCLSHCQYLLKCDLFYAQKSFSNWSNDVISLHKIRLHKTLKCHKCPIRAHLTGTRWYFFRSPSTDVVLW